MASVFSHIAIPIGITLALGYKRVPRSLMEAGAISSVMADLDCLAFNFGIPYESQWGHRGFTHSIVMALAVGGLFAWRQKEQLVKPWGVFLFTFICAMSHPLLDAMTDGGLGIAFFWPFSAERYFFPFNPIPVSPIGRGFLSEQGLNVALTELKIIWAPCMAFGVIGYLTRRFILKEKMESPAPPAADKKPDK